MRANLAKEQVSEIVNERRRQQRAVDTRERILEAAFDEFADKGFDGASTRAVAAKVGIQHPLVRYHFKNKDGLWKAVVTAVSFNFVEYFNELHAETGDEDEVAQLRRLQEGFIRFAAKNPKFHWLMSHEAKRESARLKWLVENRARSYFDTVAKLIGIAQTQGRYVKGDPYHLQYLFIGAVTRVFMLQAEVRQVAGRSPFSKPFVDQHVELCCELFFRDAPADASPAGPKKTIAARSTRKK